MRFYPRENQRRHGRLAWQWLLKQTNWPGIRGGSALRAMAGFGRQHQRHADHICELAGSLAMEMEFIVNEEESRNLLNLLRRKKVGVFYARVPADSCVVNTDPEEPAQKSEP